MLACNAPTGNRLLDTGTNLIGALLYLALVAVPLQRFGRAFLFSIPSSLIIGAAVGIGLLLGCVAARSAPNRRAVMVRGREQRARHG
jgi:hypothetical protein